MCIRDSSSAVGAGAFVSEIFGDEADELRRRGGDGGEFGATTGRPRPVSYTHLGNLWRNRSTGIPRIWNWIPVLLTVSGTDLQFTDVRMTIHGQIHIWTMSRWWSVSYTHLDVYKRQVFMMEELFEKGCRSPFLYLEAWNYISSDTTPVSYTHLDVYKRQDRRSSGRRTPWLS